MAAFENIVEIKADTAKEEGNEDICNSANNKNKVKKKKDTAMHLFSTKTFRPKAFLHLAAAELAF